MFKYKNGNTNVTISSDGTKIREFFGTPKPIYPESIDLKITNYCDLFKKCQFCHEASNTKGEHANLSDYEFLLEQLPNGAELAIGGGNSLSHPDLLSFLKKAKENNIICNLTVNERHVLPYRGFLTSLIKEELVYGIGISFVGEFEESIEYLCDLSNNIVIHLIIGIHNVSDLSIVSKYTNKILILGYKHFRKGNTFYEKNSCGVDENIYQWYIGIPKYFHKMILSFDNLSIKQLELSRWFPKKSWDKFYMGDDGNFTMYIDAVNNKFSSNSTSKKRFDVVKDIKQIFSKV